MSEYREIYTTWWSGKFVIENGGNDDFSEEFLRPHHGYLDKVNKAGFAIACQYKRCSNRSIEDGLCYWDLRYLEYGLIDYVQPDRLGLITE